MFKFIKDAALWLAIASTSLGALVGAALARTGFHSLLGAVFYGVGTAIFLTSAFVYCLIRKIEGDEHTASTDLVGDWNFESTTRTSNKKAVGQITFEAAAGRISGRGPVFGEKGDLIAQVISEACGYEKGWLTMVYRYSAQDDNGKQSIKQCILSGFARKPREEIKGIWRQLDWDGNGRVGGDICLVRKPKSAPRRRTN